MMEQESTTTTTTKVEKKTTTTTVVYAALDKLSVMKVIVALAVSAGVVMIAAARVCDKLRDCDKEPAFAVAVGVIGLFLAFLLLLLQLVPSPRIVTQVVIVLSFVLWAAGAGVLTFRSPFVATGNGYFASWMAFACSVYLVHVLVPQLDKFFRYLAEKALGHNFDHQIAVIIFIASLIELIAAATLCDALNYCEKQYGWAVAVGAIATLVSLLYVALYKFMQPIKFLFPVILTAIWVPGCGVLTFDVPFVITGNGYFSSWVAFFYSVYWLIIVITHVRQSKAGSSSAPPVPATPPPA